MTVTPPRDQPATIPPRDDNRNDRAATCPACGQPFTPARRRRWCSAACRQAAWRRRHPNPRPASAGLPGTQPPARDATIYQCPQCEERYLGQQRCQDCGTFCRRVGPGGPCPHCDEPVAITDLITVTEPSQEGQFSDAGSGGGFNRSAQCLGESRRFSMS